MVNQIPQRAPRLRIVVAAAVAAVLLGSSFYAAQAGGGNNAGYNDSLNGAEIAAITLGGIGAAVVIMDVVGGDDDDDDDDASASKSKNAKAVEQVRVVSSQRQLSSGDATTVEVQARYTGSKTWTSVTDRASVRLVSGALTQVDGSKNAFAVPYGNTVVPGQATIEASFGGQSASTTVAVN